MDFEVLVVDGGSGKNMNFFKRKYVFACIYGIVLAIFTCYALTDTFVLERVYSIAKTEEESNTHEIGRVALTDTSYKDDNIEINLSTYIEYDTTIYVADIIINNAKFLKTAFANDTYGKNITSKTSNIASTNNAILAINGDYYGKQENGYVLRNGTIYRAKTSKNREDLVVYENGNFEIINEKDVSLETLLDNGAYNVFSFGPCLILDGEINVTTTDEVDLAKTSNPRTAIGIIDNLHYVFIVADGRTKESRGLSLYELAEFMKGYNVNIGYNLDGGGSSTMYFNGNIINNPTSNGKSISERKVSDIVYIGY